jgi:hypothetical protein
MVDDDDSNLVKSIQTLDDVVSFFSLQNSGLPMSLWWTKQK